MVRALECCLGIVSAAEWMSAREPEKRKFNVPSDLAEKSLRRFAVQAGSDVLFFSATSRGVRPAAIKSEFLLSEALKRMLAGTTL